MLDRAMYSSVASYSGQYMVLMVDPDASTPQNPSSRFILHWAQPSAILDPSGMIQNTTAPLVPYARPMPPPTSDPHRYIFYALQQPADFSLPPQYSGLNAQNRTRFNLTEFVSAANLGQPAAANYFFCQNKTGTPPDFYAPAGGQFPGGNGGAITAGPGPVITPTPSSGGAPSATSPAAGGTSSAAYTGAAGRVEIDRSLGVSMAAFGAAALWAL